MKMDKVMTDERIKENVREAYGDIARRFDEELTPTSCCGPSQPTSCCGPSVATVEATGVASKLYVPGELADLPDSVTDISLGCGNPTAIAELLPGAVVLDLGSGGSIDCFLAAKKVGPEGKVIGLDMTPDMIKLARRNARKVGATNVEFRYGEMEDIPLPDESVDVIISNCVINLSPDKDAVFGEAFRVLRPGGQITVSDIVLHGELPLSIRDRLDAWAACAAGALEESDYLDRIRAAGFDDVEVMSRNYVKISDSNEWEATQALLVEAGISCSDLDRTVVSAKVKARKRA
jgi:arsenite methyltransferase